MDVYYVDTSALVKLVRSEPESAALTRWLSGRTWVIGDLHRTELRRAALRAGPVSATRAERLLAEVDLVSFDGSLYDRAGRMTPAGLRTLDALHLTCALVLEQDLAGVVAYDRRLLEAARQHRIRAFSPA